MLSSQICPPLTSLATKVSHLANKNWNQYFCSFKLLFWELLTRVVKKGVGEGPGGRELLIDDQ